MAESVNANKVPEQRDKVEKRQTQQHFQENSMFLRIANTGVVVKSQQLGEIDLTVNEKVQILKDLYYKNKTIFIYKFGHLLMEEDLICFNDPNNYELNFYTEKVKASLNPVNRDRIIRNRRYNYLQNVLKNTDYFADNELESRDPLLYRQYIDQYKTDEERMKEKDESLQTKTFSQFLFGTIDRDINNFRCELEVEAQNQEEEEDDEDDNNSSSKIEKDMEFEKYLDDKVPITNEEKERLHREFSELMQNRFLDGKDDFDYSVIDNNETYDNIKDQDFEDSYFDEEEPADCD